MKNKTKVYFVMEPNAAQDDSAPLALFPEEKHNERDHMCYAHLGQHSSCNLDFCLGSYPKATPNEYQPLYEELTKQVGYSLEVLTQQQVEKYVN